MTGCCSVRGRLLTIVAWPGLDDVAEVGVGLVIGVAGEGLARGLDVEVLAEAAGGDGVEAGFDEVHRVGVGAEGFGGGRLVPVGGTAEGEQGTKPCAADAEAAGDLADGVAGVALDVGGAQDAGEGKLGREEGDRKWARIYANRRRRGFVHRFHRWTQMGRRRREGLGFRAKTA